MNYQFKNGLAIEYEIIRKKNKNLYFRIKDDLKLYITCPMYISQKEIEKLILKNEESLLKMYEKVESKVKDNDKFWHLGKKYYIVIDENIENITFKEKEVIVKNKEELISYQNKEMLRIFNEEVEIAKKCFSALPDFTLKTRKMKTRWGVCDTRKKIITLNTELIKKEIMLIDYVIIHELCHFFEGNHSKAFWDLVKLAYPNYKEARKKLRS
ncbi:MAG: M48 family metallopeptidase [Firmicutes bacterium]|nr:M48 family metallopeptidase [Bacillota bacterium]